MKDALPINIEVLKWARESLGLSVKDVSVKIKRTEKEIKEWESGKSSPTYPQLEKLAYEIYKRPVAVFFFPSIPDEENPKTEFRTLPEAIIDKLPVEIIRLYRKAKIFQFNLAELFDDLKPVSPNLIDNFTLTNSASIKNIASDIREDIGVTISDQFSWQSLDIAFKNWRMAFENRGIFVFKDAFSNDDYSGFCVYDEKFPIIYVNNSMPISRQIFTLFHELGHLLYHLGGVDFRDNRIIEQTSRKYQLYEKNCNKFANETLVPSDIFISQDLQISEKKIKDLANDFSVSREVILRNYFDIGLIDDNYYNKMVSKWAKESEKRRMESKGGNYYYNQITYLGNTYIDLVFRKYYQNRITIENLSSYLNIKESNISSFEHYAFG
jgi:Zn-dependent peptidase ImmA (M78 family)